MSTTGIRLVVPGGAAYESVLVEGASKTAARRDLSDHAVTTFAQLISLATRAIGSTSPKAVELKIDPHVDRIEALLSAQAPSAAIEQSSCVAFHELADSVATGVEVDRAAATIRFDFPMS